ncbi:MAG: hypothetical protein P4K98_04250 [Bryobacteraceae bacterium]|nr:hypothetical protein [Bryobacteraceae bacterium]
MQIDFHHTVTYVLSRLAGFTHENACVVAYAAQYVDDATNKGTVRFTNGKSYERIASSHEVFDIANNCVNAEDYEVWVPFHFLPGNDGATAGQHIESKLVQRVVCTPDSPLATDMIQACLGTRGAMNGLHRLGITAHVYEDTWAHQSFAGVKNRVNLATHVAPARLLENVQSRVAELLELGHGAVLTHPDLPFLDWKYRNSFGGEVARSNVGEFTQACKRVFSLFASYRGEPGRQFPEQDQSVLAESLGGIRDAEGSARHLRWMALIGDGRFSFGALNADQIAGLEYVPKGPGSWKHAALGTTTTRDDPKEQFEYSPSFEASNWKLFHDALKEHHTEILHAILPRYGLPNSYEEFQRASSQEERQVAHSS